MKNRSLMAAWVATTRLTKSSKRQSSCSLIKISPASSALEQVKLRPSVSQTHACRSLCFNGCYPATYYPSTWSTLCEKSRLIARRVHKTPHDVLNTLQEYISASMLIRG